MKTFKKYFAHAIGLSYLAVFVVTWVAFPEYTGYLVAFSGLALAFAMCASFVWVLVWFDLDWRSWRTWGATCIVAGLVSLVLLSFVEGVVYRMYLGGDPFRGKIVGTHFYLGGTGGRTIEVSKRFWWTSYSILTALRSLTAVFLVMGVALIYIGRRKDPLGGRYNERAIEISTDDETPSPSGPGETDGVGHRSGEAGGRGDREGDRWQI